MSGALKTRDLQRDPRFALHGPPVLLSTETKPTGPGDAKISGRANPETDRDRIKQMLTARGMDADAFTDSHFFTAGIEEAVLTQLEGPTMTITLWRPGHPLHHTTRT
ncbi:pyridoxamine 5-phosphate oxidase, partial [Actinomadura darangshiensis]